MDHHIQYAIALQKRAEEYFVANPIKDGYKKCDRCNGLGALPKYGHNLQGVCFKCKGNRVVKIAKRKAIPQPVMPVFVPSVVDDNDDLPF